MMQTDELRTFLDREVPEYEPARLDVGTHVLDASIAGWLSNLGRDIDRHLTAPPRSHAAPVRIRVGGVDARPARGAAATGASPRDAVCCLDTVPPDRFEYWLLFSRSLIHDLYFLFSAIELGPSELVPTSAAGGSGPHVDVRGSSFRESGHGVRAAGLTCVALEFVCLHELTHAIRAHVPFLRRHDTLPRACLCEIGSLSPPRPTVPDLHQAIEIDADLTALALQLHFASKGERATSVVGTGDAVGYAADVGFVLGVAFRVFELWRRHLRGIAHDRAEATHPHPDVREVLCDAWLAQRAKEPGELDPALCRAVRQGRDAGQRAVEQLGTHFLPRMTYIQDRSRDAVQAEIERVQTTLYEVVRPTLREFVAVR